MPNIDEIIKLIEDLSGVSDISEDSDIFSDIGLVGDDFDEFLEKYSEKYKVDMTEYLWYFHTDEEGAWNSIGGIFFAPPNKKVKRIPVTPKLLLNFIKIGKWNLKYPAHAIPKRRYDILINQLLTVAFVIWVLVWIVLKMIKE